MTNPTFTEAYIQLNRDLHASPRKFGGDGDKHKSAVHCLAIDYGIKTMLDYGCGQGLLKGSLTETTLKITNYDPAIPEHAAKPEGTFDLVTCTDVLEHIEPEYLDAVLKELCAYTGKVAYLVIACVAAGKCLADGRNAHLIQEQPPWWLLRLNRLQWKVVKWHTTPDKHQTHLAKRLTVTLEKI